jgi:hypothetical protein
MSADTPTFEDKFHALSEDHSFKMNGYLSLYLDTKNPVYMWEAIKFCTDHNLHLPEFVYIYLRAVANIMLSDEVRQCPDLREILPHDILLFPKKKSGPGRLLDPDAAPDDRTLFTIKFLCKLEQNREWQPSKAFEETQCEIDVSVGDKDDKTLWRWLTEELGLPRRPKTNAEWRAAGRARYFPFLNLVEEEYRDLARRQTENKGAGRLES